LISKVLQLDGWSSTKIILNENELIEEIDFRKGRMIWVKLSAARRSAAIFENGNLQTMLIDQSEHIVDHQDRFIQANL
jgi:hypothetical protein